MNIISKSEYETGEAAQNLAATLGADEIVLLHGNLGMGKTVFARALIHALCKQPTLEVISPTFTLVQTYDAPSTPIHHYDLYRLKDPEEIFELGWEDSIAEGITIVEWPERLGTYKPASYLDIHITSSENHTDHRHIDIKRV